MLPFFKRTIATSLAALAVIGCLAGCSPSGRSAPDAPKLAKAERSTFRLDVNELGAVESTRVIQIDSPYSARIISILDSGTVVKKGDVVITLDTKEQTDRLEERIEELKEIKSEMEREVEDLMIALRGNALDFSASEAQLDLQRVQLEQVNLDLAELEYLRSREIVPQDDVRTGISRVRTTQINTLSRDLGLRSEATGSQSTESSKQIQLERLSLRGEKATERYAEARDRIDASQIKAPVDGIFLRNSRWSWQNRRNSEREAGESVREGERLGSIPDLTTIIVRSQIPESEVLRVKVGMNVSLVFEALGNLELPGTVTTIAPLAIERETSAGGKITAGGQELTGERVFEIEVAFGKTDPRLKPGLTARARIQLDQRENLLTIPLEAVRLNDAEHIVYVVTPASKSPERRTVVLGQANENRVEVISGLSEGEQIILNPPAAI